MCITYGSKGFSDVDRHVSFQMVINEICLCCLLIFQRIGSTIKTRMDIGHRQKEQFPMSKSDALSKKQSILGLFGLKNVHFP